MVQTTVKKTKVDATDPHSQENHEVVVAVRVVKHRELPNGRTGGVDYFVRFQAGDKGVIPNDRIEIQVPKEKLETDYPVGKSFRLEVSFHTFGPMSIVSLDAI